MAVRQAVSQWVLMGALLLQTQDWALVEGNLIPERPCGMPFTVMIRNVPGMRGEGWVHSPPEMVPAWAPALSRGARWHCLFFPVILIRQGCLFHVLHGNSSLSLPWIFAEGFSQDLLQTPLPSAGTQLPLQLSSSTGTPPRTFSAWQTNFHSHLFPGSLAANESLQEVFLPFASVINLKPWDHCTKT